VDVDGTLVAGDVFWESLLCLLRRNPRIALTLPRWLLRGRAYVKRQVALQAPLDARLLPYRPEVLAFIEESLASGRPIVLATAADQSHASAIAAHLGVFTDVIASDGVLNLSGRQKARCLEQRFGTGQFDYVGNDWVDVPTWLAAGRATIVAAPGRLCGHLTSRLESVRVIVPPRHVLRSAVRALRPYQWVKNLLVFLPLIAAHRILELDLAMRAAWAFVAFCLCASSIYVVNDLLDIQADREHPRKRQRPFASGELSIPTGLSLSAAVLALGLLIGTSAVSPVFGACLVAYVATTSLYSLKIKREPVLDVFLLTGFYVLRIFAGGVATGIEISTWLLAFAMFFFLNLALIKRYTGIVNAMADAGTMAGRGYKAADLQWMQILGVGAGCMSVLVLALYAVDPAVATLYRSPSILILLCPLLLYWIARSWFQAVRETLEDDPLLVAVRDPVSYGVLSAAALILLAAAR
jgi:4-hydroxybenzoate polyprenyltransferase